MQNFLKINDKDNVVVALKPITRGEQIAIGEQVITVREDIPAGHKLAVCDISEGARVIKYGYPIGYAKEPILAGSWIHTHNIRTALGELLEYTYEPVEAQESRA